MKLRIWLSAAALATGMSSLCSAQITGTATLDGKAPVMKEIDMSSVKACKEAHTDPVMDQKVVADDKGNLANVIVSIKNAPEGNYDVPADPAVIDQKGCIYDPHVLAMMKGQKLVAKNEDPFAHNVHTLPKLNQEQNIQQPNVDPGKELKTPKVAERFRVKCDIHGWMTMYLAVFDHPFFAVSGEDGKFSIPTKGLKDGDYEIEAWQEMMGVQAGTVKVKDGKGTVDFKFKPKTAQAAPAVKDLELAAKSK